ncbi:MAG: hypothetical protein U1F55_06380 [Chitinivorax sp.]
MPWYAIRTVYHFGVKSDGKNVFEERMVSFEASCWSEAHAKAEAESRTYAMDREVSAHPERVGYETDGEQLIDGYEIWSELFESPLSLKEFYTERYDKYEYHPE